MNNKISACVVLVNPEGLVLGVSRKDDHTDFGLIGGKMEDIDGGDPMKTAERECIEETGLTPYDLELVFATYKQDGYLCYTYLAKYKGEILHDEPHVVKWVGFNTLMHGSFGEYNEFVYDSLTYKGIRPLLFPKPTDEYIFAIFNYHGESAVCFSSRKFWEERNVVFDLSDDRFSKENDDIISLLWNNGLVSDVIDETSYEIYKNGLTLEKNELIDELTSAGFIYDKEFNDEINS